MANKAFVYIIYPNQIQDRLCQKTFGCCRFVYNQMLTVQQNRYKNNENHLSKISANNYCNQVLKVDYPFLKEAVSQHMVDICRKLIYNNSRK